MLVHQDIPNHGSLEIPAVVDYVLDEADFDQLIEEHPEIAELRMLNRFTPGNPENEAMMENIDKDLIVIKKKVGEAVRIICMFPPEDSLTHQPAFYVYGPDKKRAA